MKPLVTIVIPVYNVARYLEECVSSVRAQTYANLEILLIDDGSDDGSGETCDRLAEADPRIRVIHQPNRGLPAARNTGIDAAGGAYIAFIDSDDVIMERYVEVQLTHLLETGADFVISGFMEYADGRIISLCIPQAECLNRQQALRDFLRQKRHMNAAWNKLYSMALFQRIRYPEGALFEDFATIYRIIDCADRIAAIPEVLYRYRIRSDSIMQSGFSRQKLQLIAHAEELSAYIAARHPDMADLAAYCTMYCCFTTLRRMLYANPRLIEEEQAIRRKILLLSRQVSRELLSPRDRIGLVTLKMGTPFFKLAWSARVLLRSHFPNKTPKERALP